MTDLTIFHTAQVHCAAFDRLAPQAKLRHVVCDQWLARAQNGIDEVLRAEITLAIQAIEGPVLCSCTTIGEVAEAAGATRIDWPMMQRAAEIGGPVLLVYCLDSTKKPSEALLRRAFGDVDPQLTCLNLKSHWPVFATGKTGEFAAAIAEDVAQAMKQGVFSCVVLAQASMAGAAEFLESDVPVLASPQIAAQALLTTPNSQR